MNCYSFILLFIYYANAKILLERKNNIKFSEIFNFNVSLSNVENDNMISVKLLYPFVYNDNKSQVAMFANLNEEPRIDKLIYKYKSDKISHNATFNFYQIDISQCEYEKTDSLFIQIVGIEGEITFTLIVEEYYNKDIKVFTCNKESETGGIYTSSKEKIYKMSYTGNVYEYREDNTKFYLIEVKNNKKPSFRTKGIFHYFNNKLYLYGGEYNNKTNVKLYTDLWKFDLKKKQWTQLILKSHPAAISHSVMESSLIYFFTKTKQYPFALFSINVNTLNTELIPINDICHYNSFSFSFLNSNQLLLYGGSNKDNVLCSEYTIITLLPNLSVKSYPLNSPSASLHSILHRIGSTVLLIIDNSMWKFLIDTNQWKKLSLSTSSLMSPFAVLPYKEDITLIISNKDVIYSLIAFTKCQSDTEINKDSLCLPCNEGTFFDKSLGKCSKCDINSYYKYESLTHYSKGKCTQCPIDTHNNFTYGSDISSCIISSLHSKSMIAYQSYPDYLHSEDFIDRIVKRGYFVIVVIISMMVVGFVFWLMYKITSASFTQFVVDIDCVMLTGGKEKNKTGGVLSLLFISVLSLILVIAMTKFFVYNIDYKIDSIDSIHNSNAMMNITLKILSNEIDCENDITIKNSFSTNIHTIDNKTCVITMNEDSMNYDEIDSQIRIDIKSDKDIFIKSFEGNISYKWTSEDKDLDYFSNATFIFSPNTSKVFVKGNKENILNITVTSIDYYESGVEAFGFVPNISNIIEGSVDDKISTNGDITFIINFQSDEKGLRIEKTYDISETVFFMFILITVILMVCVVKLVKYVIVKTGCERSNYREFKEEKKIEMKRESERSDEEFIPY